MRLSALTLVMSLLLVGCGDSDRVNVGQYGLPIINGTNDTNPDHAAVVALTVKYGSHYIFCTGTLISRDVVLTAAHCLTDQSTNSFYVVFGNNMLNVTERRVADFDQHPLYVSQQYPYDIGVVRLQTDAPASVTPIPYLPHNIGLNQLDINKPMEFVGFGEDENRNTGVKLTVTNDLNWLCTNSSGCNVGPGYWAAMNTNCQDQQPGGPCSGDSGGPAFITRDGQEYVAGITSYGDENCAYYGCSTTVDEYESFIIDYVGGENGASCTSSSQCDSGNCVDGVCCATTCPGECMACNVGGSWGTCVTVPNGTGCPDSNQCNGTETCQNGVCASGQPLDCSNANKCTDDDCAPASGCLYSPMPDGTNCANANICDGQEKCVSGICQPGIAADCDDHNPCTQDSCVSSMGCQYAHVADGTSCGGGQCGTATCTAGECVASDQTLCEDNNPCTKDWCNPETGCEHVNLQYGYACGECLMCNEGQCVEAPDCEASSGCGCSHSSSPVASGLGFLLLMLGLVLRRRR
ncbi:MAG: trypsin-like serine protease [Deltaproteobacteria bacterium]|nr:trypsin-like serine protease [Deltaproteobacteria bacterium]